MSAKTVSPPKVRTLADYIDRLGGIPLDRIRFTPYPGSATERDLVTAADEDGFFCELVDRTLVEKPMGYSESVLAAALIEFIRAFVRPKNRGIVSGEQGMMRLRRGLVRGPDVAFVSWKRLPKGRVPRKRVPNLAPDLAVEILSKSNTRAEMARKRREYFAAGAMLVWEIDPRLRRVRVYSNPEEFVELTESDVLNGGKVLPGFSLPLRELFGELDREGPANGNGKSK